MRRISVLIAEDHPLVRESLRKLLESDPELKVVGEAKDGRQAVRLAKKLHPDVVLMDIAMPVLDGVAATRAVLKALPEAKILILPAHNDDAYIKGATESDTVAFLLNQSSGHDVCRAIREAWEGPRRPRPSVSGPVKRVDPPSLQPAGPLVRRAVHLTSREMEVLQRIAEGKANKVTAAELGIGIKTVEKHREHIMEKLDIHETAGLTRFAIAAGIIENRVEWRLI
jgi:DNA-binding NarL/FixJ family response regulator